MSVLFEFNNRFIYIYLKKSVELPYWLIVSTLLFLLLYNRHVRCTSGQHTQQTPYLVFKVYKELVVTV